MAACQSSSRALVQSPLAMAASAPKRNWLKLDWALPEYPMRLGGESGVRCFCSFRASSSAEGLHICQVCQAAFPSRSKLFKHIEQTGHAILVGGGGGGSKKKKKKK